MLIIEGNQVNFHNIQRLMKWRDRLDKNLFDEFRLQLTETEDDQYEFIFQYELLWKDIVDYAEDNLSLPFSGSELMTLIQQSPQGALKAIEESIHELSKLYQNIECDFILPQPLYVGLLDAIAIERGEIPRNLDYFLLQIPILHFFCCDQHRQQNFDHLNVFRCVAEKTNFETDQDLEERLARNLLGCFRFFLNSVIDSNLYPIGDPVVAQKFLEVLKVFVKDNPDLGQEIQRDINNYLKNRRKFYGPLKDPHASLLDYDNA
jgi:hypothetical protein